MRGALIKATPALSAFFTRLMRPISMAKWITGPIERIMPAQAKRVLWLTNPTKWYKRFRVFLAGKVPSQTARTTWLSRFTSILHLFGNRQNRPTLNDKRTLLNNNQIIHG